jgi:hypothetical protein
MEHSLYALYTSSLTHCLYRYINEMDITRTFPEFDSQQVYEIESLSWV